MSKRYQDEDWLRQQFIEANLTTQQVAEECDVTPTTIQKYAREFDIATKPYQREDRLRTCLIERDMEAIEVAEELGCSPDTISTWADKFDIDWKPEPEKYEEDWLQKKVYEEGKRPIHIAKELGLDDMNRIADHCREFFGCSAAYKDAEWVQDKVNNGWTHIDIANHCDAENSTVMKWFNKFNIDFDYTIQNNDGKYHNADWLEKQYHNGDNAKEIAEKCNVSRHTIYHWKEKLGVDTRPKWYKEDWCRKQIETGLTYREIAEKENVRKAAISNGMEKAGVRELYWDVHDIEDTESKEKVEIPEEKLKELFIKRGWSYEEIAKHLETSPCVVQRRLRDYEINQKQRPAPLNMTRDSPKSNGRRSGYMEWKTNGQAITVHRLLMVAEHGAEAVADMHVHHKSLRWDNRPETLELMTPKEHHQLHGQQPHHTSDEREIHEVPRPPDPDQKEIEDFESQDPLAF